MLKTPININIVLPDEVRAPKYLIFQQTKFILILYNLVHIKIRKKRRDRINDSVGE